MVTARFAPQTAATIEQTGLTRGLIIELILKHVYAEGSMTLGAIAARTRLSFGIVDIIFRHFQREQLCETRGTVGEDYEITLTGKGRALAESAYIKSHYVGPAPVPLAEYNAAVTAQGIEMEVNQETVSGALQDLVLSDSIITDLGAALAMRGTILLYGGTGNGKTSIAERLYRLFSEPVFIPYSVDVNGVIMNVFDPALHQPWTEQDDIVDPRWILCRRPVVKVGGELRVEMLEPRMDDVTRVCIAPLQMKANNGILVIDDFGRQRISPRELLNRWIVPLDRRRDVLTLWTGISFEIPFEMLVIFSTNLSLDDLAEEAFMRRLKNKIKVDPLDADLFKRLIARVWREKDLPFDVDVEDYLCEKCAAHSPDGLRACYPADIAAILCGIAIFEKRAPTSDKVDLDRALRLYFVR